MTAADIDSEFHNINDIVEIRRLKQDNAHLRESLLGLSVAAQRISEEAASALARDDVPQSELSSAK